MHISSEGRGLCWPILLASTWSIVMPASMSWPSVRFGCAALKYTAAVREWSPALSSGESDVAMR